MSAHTPGPWQATNISAGGMDYGAPIRVLSASGAAVASHGETGCFLRADDARLIAAAPDLLAACLAVLACDDDDKHGVMVRLPFRIEAMLKSAIAKAEGRQP